MAIVKFVTARCPMNNIFPYVMNREKTDGGILVSGIHCMPETALDEFRFIKNKFDKTDGRQYYHIVQSFSPDDNLDAETAHEIGLKFAEFFPGYQIVIASHCNTSHLHNHIIMNSVNMENGKKFHQTARELARAKEYSNQLCQEYGLSVTEVKSSAQLYHKWKDLLIRKAFSIANRIRKICAILEAEKIENPSVYLFKTRGTRSGNPDLQKPYSWTQTTVRRMLSNRIYCGDTVNFQTYSKSNKLKKRIKNAEEDMLIFENTHEAIIDRKTFDMVQKHFEGRKRPDIQGEMDKYAGYLFCGECGSRLYLHRAFSIDPEKNFFQCGGYQTKGKSHCTAHYISESVVDTIVLADLKRVTEYARSHTEEFYAMATENGEAEAKKFYASAEKEKKRIDSRIKELDNIIRYLYEDRVTGRITPERYDTMAGGYEQEQASLREELQALNEQMTELDMREHYVNEFISKAKEYIEMPKLTPELLRVFIRKI